MSLQSRVPSHFKYDDIQCPLVHWKLYCCNEGTFILETDSTLSRHLTIELQPKTYPANKFLTVILVTVIATVVFAVAPPPGGNAFAIVAAEF